MKQSFTTRSIILEIEKKIAYNKKAQDKSLKNTISLQESINHDKDRLESFKRCLDK